MDRILAAGHPILLIPTFAMKDFRRRDGIGGAKSDRGDGSVLADVARTDGHRLRRLEPLAEHTKALRAVVRTRDDPIDQRRDWPTSCRPPWRPPGQALRRSSPTSTPRSA